METSIPFDSLVKLVDAEDITNEKIRTNDLPLKANIVSSNMQSQNLSSETCDSNLEVMFTQKTIRKKSKPQNQNYCNYSHYNKTTTRENGICMLD